MGRNAQRGRASMVRKEYVLEVEADMAFSQADVEMSGVLDREGLSRFLEQLCPERLRPDDAALDMVIAHCAKATTRERRESVKSVEKEVLEAVEPIRVVDDTFDALMAEFKAAGQLTVPSSQPSALDPAAESRSRGPVPGPPPATLKPARGWSPRASPSDSCKVLPIDDDVSPRDSYTLHPLQKDSLPRPSPRRSPPSLSRPALSDGCSKEERLRTTAPQPTAAWGAPPPPDAATSTREGGARFSIEQPRPEAEARITRDAAVHAYLKYAYYLHHRREMEEIFDRFDLNRDNQLELTELANVLEWIEKRNVVRRHGTFFAMAHEVKVGKHELLQVMRRCDVNANGKIDRAEAIPAMAYWTEYARVRDAEGNSGKCALM